MQDAGTQINGFEKGSRILRFSMPGIWNTGIQNTEIHYSEIQDTRIHDTGIRETGIQETGVHDTGIQDTCAWDIGIQGYWDPGLSGSQDTGIQDTARGSGTGTHTGTWIHDTGFYDTGIQDIEALKTLIFRIIGFRKRDSGNWDSGYWFQDPGIQETRFRYRIKDTEFRMLGFWILWCSGTWVKDTAIQDN
jgi:hypothetical protein